MSAGNPGQKVYVYAVFSSLIHVTEMRFSKKIIPKQFFHVIL